MSLIFGSLLAVIVRRICPEGGSEFKEIINLIISLFIIVGTIFSGMMMISTSYKNYKRPFFSTKS